MRKKIVAGNWKMNLSYQEGISLFSEIVNMVSMFEGIESNISQFTDQQVTLPFLSLKGK